VSGSPLITLDPKTNNKIATETAIKIKGIRTIIHETNDNPDPHNIFNKKVTTTIIHNFITAICGSPLNESTNTCIKLNII
jgi:hypothetical protein